MRILADDLVDKVDQGEEPPPGDWVSRRLFPGREGARRWSELATEPSYAEHVDAPYGLQALCREAVAGLRAGTLVSLGPGEGTFDAQLVAELGRSNPGLIYLPVDISRGLLEEAGRKVGAVAEVPVGVLADVERNADLIGRAVAEHGRAPVLFAMLGCTVCNLDLGEPRFFEAVRGLMRIGDSFLLDLPLAGPAWTSEADPRLDTSAYPEALRRFLARDLPPGVGEPGAGDAAVRIGCTVREEGAVEGTRLFDVHDPATGRSLLRIRLYEWDAVLAWLRRAGFVVAFSRCSLATPDDPLGMGVVRLMRAPGAAPP